MIYHAGSLVLKLFLIKGYNMTTIVWWSNAWFLINSLREIDSMGVIELDACDFQRVCSSPITHET